MAQKLLHLRHSKKFANFFFKCSLEDPLIRLSHWTAP